MARAEELYRLAIEFDPQYALAHAGYADYLIGTTMAGLSSGREVAPLVRAEAAGWPLGTELHRMYSSNPGAENTKIN